MDRALADLIRTSREVGGDLALVQGGGGNTSVKTTDGEFMYVKASGTALKEMSETRGWRRLRLAPTLAMLEDPAVASLEGEQRDALITSQLGGCCADECDSNARPSVESHLHALLGRYVVHLHPVAVGAYVCAKEGQAQLGRLLAKVDLPWLWVPYVSPGYTLAAAVKRLVARYVSEHGALPTLLFLEKHGLFVTADSPAAALEATQRAIALCGEGFPALRGGRTRAPREHEVRAFGYALRKALLEATGRHFPVRHFLDETIGAFLAHGDAKQLTGWPALTPEEIVYGGAPLWVERPEAAAIARRLTQQQARGEKPATGFLVPGVGLFIAGPDATMASTRDIVAASLQVRAATASFGGAKPLTAAQRTTITQWEGEHFRRKVIGLDGGGELTGQIAVVTGAGSGLGRSIALGLANAGAAVALLDVDEAAARETAARAPGRTLPLRVNVTNEAEVAQAYEAVLARWGGLDILVNAASIAPPYALVDLPVEKWRAALEINLTGYFLLAQGAARIMIAQGMGGNIINLSSKSGLEASRDNTPYNATKAGEIHLARGWALELGAHGIRVNSIAPGNVFEGSKIWNPEYIKVCAKKYGIAPEEVIPYYVNRTALKREIKGRDVADAVIFLCSDRARTITGQTLVVDSGQVMVR